MGRSVTYKLLRLVLFHALGIGGLILVREVASFRRLLPQLVVLADLVHLALLSLRQVLRALNLCDAPAALSFLSVPVGS